MSALSAFRTWMVGRGGRGRVLRSVALLVVALGMLVLKNDAPVVAATTAKTTTYSFFKGRASVTVPKGAKKPRKLSAAIYLVQPSDSKQRFALYISRDSLGKDERKMSKKALGSSIKKLLEADGYSVTSMKMQGADYVVNFTTYANVPWQKVGTAPARGVAKFTRTADNQLIGSALLCDPPAWSGRAIKVYKTTVAKTKVTQR